MPDAPDIKPRSRDVTDGLEKAAARGMLRAVGMGDDDWEKPQIGVASSWNEITPCNLSLDRLAKAVKNGVHAAGGYPLEFGTISVSDGISMGHEGMHFSLVSREVIADSVETVMMAERLDGSVLLAGCDKSLPGMMMAAARLDLSSVFLYAGSIMPGQVDGNDVTIIDAFEAVGACLAGKISREEVTRIEKAARAGTDGLEDVDDREVTVTELARHRRARVQEDAGEVEPGRGHEHAGQRLVAAGQQHRAVEPLGEHDRLHRVGDDLAAHQGGAHALVAHGDAVGDRDRAELQRETAGGVDALLGPLRQPVQGQVAGGDLVPGRRDADLRLGEVVVAHADRPQHGARRRLGIPVGHLVAARLHRAVGLGAGAGILDGRHDQRC